MLANSDFYTEAFPAEIGNALAGAFDLNFRKGNNQKRENTFQIGVIGIEVKSHVLRRSISKISLPPTR